MMQGRLSFLSFALGSCFNIHNERQNIQKTTVSCYACEGLILDSRGLMLFWYCRSCWLTKVLLTIFSVCPVPPDAYKSILYLRLQWSESCLQWSESCLLSMEASGGQNRVWTTFASLRALWVFLKVLAALAEDEAPSSQNENQSAGACYVSFNCENFPVFQLWTGIYLISYRTVFESHLLSDSHHHKFQPFPPKKNL